MHTCSTMVLHCMDFRLGSAIRNELEKRELLDDCDIVALAGAGRPIISDDPKSWHDMTLSHIELSQKLHGTKKLLIMNHTDCGAYGGHEAFANLEEEENRHRSDMKQARERVLEIHPNLEVELVLLHMNSDGSMTFEDVK